MAAWIICYFFALVLIFSHYSVTARSEPPNDYPTANLSTTWTNTNRFNYTNAYIPFQPILLRGSSGPKFACGFYCNGACTSYLFAVYIVLTTSSGGIVQDGTAFPQVIWSANRESPVSIGAILNFTATGNLVLQDVDGSTVWTSNTSRKSVAGMHLTDTGKLVLFDVNSSVVWQSFDYPTDCLVPGQSLFQGQQLIPSVSSTNWTAQKGLFSLQRTDEGLFAYGESNPPQIYFRRIPRFERNTNKERKYVRFLNGSLSLFFSSTEPDYTISIPKASLAQYMKFMPDGHLKVFEWKEAWLVVADLLINKWYGECTYPFACGRNAICSNNQQCSCPVSSSSTIDYFRAVNDRQPNQGCSAITPLTCNGTEDQVFILLDNVVFHGECLLGWELRKKIILDIAKGLTYLHEECTQKIIHLDTKPQNILLDKDFNAKVSDFGLSKLIDKDQSQVMTTMRGTPGYMAPEWLSSCITEKVDIYSFGMVS